MKKKIIILLSACVFACVSSFAQVRTDINARERSNSSDDVSDDNTSSNIHSHDYSIGLGIGATKLYGPLPNSRPQQAYTGCFEKNITESVTTGETLTFGYLESNGIIHSLNNFTSIDQHINVELGTLIHAFYRNYNDNIITRLIGGIYGGVGVGIINNNLTKISNPNEETFVANTGLDNPVIEKNSTALYFPMNLGYNLHIAHKLLFLRGVVLNANLLYAYTESKYIDGYDPPVRAAKNNDSYAILSVGFRCFITNYSKSGGGNQ